MLVEAIELMGGPFDGEQCCIDGSLDRINLFTELDAPPQMIAPWATKVERERRRIAVYRRGERQHRFVFAGWDFA